MKYKTADRIGNAGEYYFSKKAAEIRKMTELGLDVINLGIGSPDLVPGAEVIAAATRALNDDKSHAYAPYRSTPWLRQAIAEWYARTYSVSLDSEKQVLPLLGSKEGIFYVSMAYLNPGDCVLAPNPGYPAYTSAATLSGAEVKYYDLTERNQWLPDFEELEKADLKNCKLMWVNYPHMPTGTPASRELFEKLVAFGRRKGILICNDNPYSLVLGAGRPLSILEADPEAGTSLELNSLSKSFNMAGWRVGMLVGAEETVNAVLKVKSNVDSGMFLPVQAGAARALSATEQWHRERDAVYGKRRSFVWKIFDALGFKYSREQVGLFVWAKAPDQVAGVEQFLDRLLNEAHVFITPGSVFGSNGSRYARASLCAGEERLLEALARIERRAAASGVRT